VFLEKTLGGTMKKYVPYHAYLLRLWPTRHDGRSDYRASLESVATGQRRNFPDLESLLAFLRTQEEKNSVGPETPPINKHEGAENWAPSTA
jgi:hypothetical protein